MYLLSPHALGIHIRQNTCAYVKTTYVAIMCILEVNLCAVHCAVIFNKLATHCAKLGRSALNLVAIHKVILF